MRYDKLVAEVEEEGVSEEVKGERLKELQEYIKSHNHLYDDHGSMVIGSREKPPLFKELD